MSLPLSCVISIQHINYAFIFICSGLIMALHTEDVFLLPILKITDCLSYISFLFSISFFWNTFLKGSVILILPSVTQTLFLTFLFENFSVLYYKYFSDLYYLFFFFFNVCNLLLMLYIQGLVDFEWITIFIL